MTTPAYDPAQLLEHMDWIRALARELVRDAQLADDVVQETWRRAHERPPRDARNLRGWLAAVTRHVAINARRGETRRRVHEERGARPESLPSSAELVAQTELQRDLVGHVLELDEPYRSVIVLRYFRGLSVAEVARAKGVAQATVRSQLARERLFRFTLGPGRYRLRTWCPLHPAEDLELDVVPGEGAQAVDLTLR